MAELRQSENLAQELMDERNTIRVKLLRERWILKEQMERRKWAEVFIPEDRQDEYWDGWPQAQQDWSLSSPVRVSSNLNKQVSQLTRK